MSVKVEWGTMLFQLVAFLLFTGFFLVPGVLIINSWKRLKRIERQNQALLRLLQENQAKEKRGEIE
ncbi:hypothetical protein [Laceyella putida]|uniref:DUF4083 domain-containing protein n=1 Tax=Laceyella putida TaxID=110101 RepID=A0ABW2RNI1_9BACL